MRIHHLQHVPFEGIASIEDWVSARGHQLSGTQMYDGVLPDVENVDFLVIMGGLMGVHDEARYPWLRAEKDFIRAAVAQGKAVLGICLGAQLIADVLGAQVTKNATREIGWYPVELTAAGRQEPVFAGFPDVLTALHWHGDTFAIPEGSRHLATSAACTSQAFAYDGGRVVGLQFHLEVTPQSLGLLADMAADELTGAATQPWTSTADELLDPASPYAECQELLFGLLDAMAASVS